jgi:hypothetical protein
MIDVSLNDQSKRSIEQRTGIPYNVIVSSDAMTIDRMIEKKIGKSLSLDYSPRDKRLPARGGVFLAMKKYIKMSDIDKYLSKI